jgi:hypothetical protein
MKHARNYTLMALAALALIPGYLLLTGYRKHANIPDYVRWVEDEANGLLVKKEMDNCRLSLQYKPVEYVVLLEKRDPGLTRTAMEKRQKELEGMRYFTFSIRPKGTSEVLSEGIGSQNEYYERLDYFTSLAQNDFSIVQGVDTLPCLLYHFERNYGVSPENKIVLGFESRPFKAGTGMALLYEDRVLGCGKQQFSITAESLDKIPQLDL